MVRIGGIVATVTTIGLTLALGGCAAESADQGASGLQETSFPGVYAQNVEWLKNAAPSSGSGRVSNRQWLMRAAPPRAPAAR